MFNEDFNFASHLSKAAARTGRVEAALARGSSWAESSCAVRGALMKLACCFFAAVDVGLSNKWKK